MLILYPVSGMAQSEHIAGIRPAGTRPIRINSVQSHVLVRPQTWFDRGTTEPTIKSQKFFLRRIPWRGEIIKWYGQRSGYCLNEMAGMRGITEDLGLESWYSVSPSTGEGDRSAVEFFFFFFFHSDLSRSGYLP